jgi:hypothetical protein
MTDNIAKLKQELKELGTEDYSSMQRIQRDLLVETIARLESTPEEQIAYATKAAKLRYVDSVSKAYNEASKYGLQAPHALRVEAEAHWTHCNNNSAYYLHHPEVLVAGYLGRNPE